MSPTRRRRAGDSSIEAAAESAGTAFTELADATAAPPEEPEWMREAAGAVEEDPQVRARPDPEALAAARAARTEQIVRALNPEQARAVTTTEGPLLILAGAGSGKTRVLAHRIAYLVGVKDVAPWRILAVTFTNRAAAELRERIISLVGEGGRDVMAGTFHALCARVLRQDGEAIGISRRFVIYDTDDQQSLMKVILREEDLPLTGEFRPSVVLGAISRAKNEMLDPTFLSEHAANHRGAPDRPPRDALSRAAAQCPGARLRRSAARGRPPVRRGPGRPREVPGALALSPRRRVPGHQSRSVPVGQGPGREAPQPVRGGRRRPVDLLVAWRGPAQHPRLRARLAGHRGRQARTELPFDPALAYLRILRSDTDSVSFERIINVPARGIGERTIEVLRAAAAREDGTTWAAIDTAARGELEGIAPRTRNALAEFAALVRRLRARVGALALAGERPRTIRS